MIIIYIFEANLIPHRFAVNRRANNLCDKSLHPDAATMKMRSIIFNENRIPRCEIPCRFP